MAIHVLIIIVIVLFMWRMCYSWLHEYDNHGVIPHGLDDAKIDEILYSKNPIKKVATCQFCGRGIVPGAIITACEGCGAPILPIAVQRREVPGPGPSNPLFRTGMEQNLWHPDRPIRVSTRVGVEVDELRGDNHVLIHRSESYVDPYLEEYVERGFISPREARELAGIPHARKTYDDIDYRLLGKEKR